MWAHPLSTSVTIEMMLYVLMVKVWEYKLYPPKSLLSLSSIWHLIQNPVEIINFNEIKKMYIQVLIKYKLMEYLWMVVHAMHGFPPINVVFQPFAVVSFVGRSILNLGGFD